MPEQQLSEKAIRKARRVDLEYAGINGIASAIQEPQDFERPREGAIRVRRWVKRLDALLEELDALLDLPGVELVKVEASRHPKSRGTLPFELARQMILGHIYKGVCPTCEGAGCGDCLGRGWVSETEMGRITALAERGYR